MDLGGGDAMASIVLVAETDDGLRSDYRNWLVDEGYGVLVAASGLEALELARMHDPSLLLMNLDLPGLDGTEAARVLRRDPRLCTIKIVGLVDPATYALEGPKRAADCNAVLREPIGRQALITAARRFLHAGLRQSHVRAKVDAPAPQGEAASFWFRLGRKPPGRPPR